MSSNNRIHVYKDGQLVRMIEIDPGKTLSKEDAAICMSIGMSVQTRFIGDSFIESSLSSAYLSDRFEHIIPIERNENA